MKPELLLGHFDRISDAPDAIPRLRRFIFDLAVRGKLVERNPADEPVSELLSRIRAKKAQLIKDGRIPKEKLLPPIENDEVPFKLPSNWCWVRLNDITSYIQRGKSPKYATGDGVPIISQKCVQWRGLELESAKRITRESIETYEDIRFLQGGDLLWNSTGTGTIGRIVRVTNPLPKLVCDSHVTVVRCLEVDAEYVRSWLRSDSVYGSIEDRASGSTNQVELTSQMAVSQLVPLPPFVEQHRIVGKIDELMTLCDQLEASRTERDSNRNRLVSASLYHLNNGTNAEAFRKHAHFYLNHISSLASRPEQIHALRQTILNLAVRGQLVPQDSKDEPATSLLKCIVTENVTLLKAKEIRAQKSVPPAESFETKTVIPNTWVHAYLQELAYQITDGTHLTPNYTEQGRPFLSAQNVKPFRFMPQRHRFVSDVDFENYRANRKPERGDVLLTRVGAGIGEAAVLDSDLEFAFYVSLCLIKIPTRFLNPNYLVLWLNSPEGRSSSTVRTYGKGASQGNLNLSLIRTFKIPLPPTAEQYRIVAKVDQLMALCDRLEAQITVTREEGGRLLEAVLTQALNDNVRTEMALLAKMNGGNVRAKGPMQGQGNKS